MRATDGDFTVLASGKQAIGAAGSVLREKEITRRLLIKLALVLFCAASAVVIWAPDGREFLVSALLVVLLVVALGAIGAATFKIRMPGITIETRGKPKNISLGEVDSDDSHIDF